MDAMQFRSCRGMGSMDRIALPPIIMGLFIQLFTGDAMIEIIYLQAQARADWPTEPGRTECDTLAS